jgi:uncharacterized protein YjbI with pentapeptide repeats
VRSRSVVASILALLGLVGSAQVGGAERTCPNPVGFNPSEETVREIVERHRAAAGEAAAAITLCNLARPGLDLSGSDLAGLDLRAADLPRVDFSGSDLTRVYLHASNLEQGRFRGATLTEAVLRKSKLGGADFESASMTGVTLRKSDLRGARFDGADLSDADLSKADLSEASLRGARLGAASLRKAILVRADLRGADLTGANLRDADLTGANLAGATVGGADLTRAVLDGANVFETGLGAQNGVTEDQLLDAQRIPGDEFAARFGAAAALAPPASATPTPDLQVDDEQHAGEAAQAAESPQAAEGASQPIEPRGAFRVQLGAFRVEETAAGVWAKLQQTFPGHFRGLSPMVEQSPPDAGQVVWHRLQTGPFASMQAARDFCAALQGSSSDTPCFALHAAAP